MASGCRDCARCTERGIVSLIMLPIRFVLFFIWTFWVGLFIKKCPKCGHWLARHQVINGRFAD